MTADVIRACRDCGASFVLDVAEQRRYEGPGQSLPTRCRLCRERRRLERDGREAHRVTCTDCGSPAFVPFEPGPGRRVLCSKCFYSGGES
jgi:CxxC-x17-CxxC domain-containing protein